jgi:Protein of unknown function (DUF3300)
MSVGRRAVAWILPLLMLVPMIMPASAQNNQPAPGTVAANSLNPNTTGNYTQQQLDQMLAPIALYPDKLVMNVLMASTYADQLAQAKAWLKQPGHAGLKGDALLNALKPEPWDPSVKAIVQFPQIVDLMTENPNWTQSLGAAFDNQQDDVLAQVQFLRQQAEKSGNLKSNDKIIVQNEGPNIVITPAQPAVVYAPYYNPAVVYGPWPWVAYPPVFFPPIYFGIGPLAFGVGWGWGPAWFIAPPLWGWYHVGWGFGGGVFFVGGGWGHAFGWYGHGWAGGGWRGGGWRHGAGGHWGYAGYHGRAGFHGAGPGGRGGFGGARGAAAGHYGRPGGGHYGGGTRGGGGHYGGGHYGGGGRGGGGHYGGGHYGGGGRGGGGHYGGAARAGGGGHGGGGHGGGGRGGGGGHRR